ncbi:MULTISPECIES: copper chaperone CopZ [Staphylococcus]|jgi:copper chaperone|uniref:Copper chaperone CopZ n=1 Tax=Staphylococcus nepalensis TaxID=214473 RepID=A0A291JHG5_9STAP|nr:MULTISPECIES: copper chaperone CopZ [Staphylococcus]ATH59182.1 copper resistance protein CopZ [Staphylococcus nepalensis]ATH64274.1 copper resistance protein CopZ [Staphylococcus nepalensis]AWI43634.1 copper resistance protein CopZ [Staphylococcus nepalensis]MBO1205481.1 copper chaperone CopZ [Staphylococcus nepalensis]MBO1212510.1 copper chaperone CopZ [Staphylococcus nepalensis]
MTTETIKVEGMSCDHCKHAVESALTNLDGVSTADVNLDAGNVKVDYDDNKVSMTNMKEAIEDQGYDAK